MENTSELSREVRTKCGGSNCRGIEDFQAPYDSRVTCLAGDDLEVRFSLGERIDYQLILPSAPLGCGGADEYRGEEQKTPHFHMYLLVGSTPGTSSASKYRARSAASSVGPTGPLSFMMSQPVLTGDGGRT